MTKINTAWIMNDLRVALAGVFELTSKFNRDVSRAAGQQFLKERGLTFKGPRLPEFGCIDADNVMSANMSTNYLQVGCSMRQDDKFESINLRDDPADIECYERIRNELVAKIEEFNQNLMANNAVIQAADKETRRLMPKYERAVKKVSRAEDKSGISAGEWIYEFISELEDSNLFEAYDAVNPGAYMNYIWKEYVDMVADEAEVLAEALLDNC